MKHQPILKKAKKYTPRRVMITTIKIHLTEEAGKKLPAKTIKELKNETLEEALKQLNRGNSIKEER